MFSYIASVSVVVLWISALVTVESRTPEEIQIPKVPPIRYDFFIKGLPSEVGDETRNVKDIYDEAVELEKKLIAEVEKLPQVMEVAKQDVERAKGFALKARSSSIRHSSALGKSSLAKNALNIAITQNGIIESGTSNAKNLMRVATRQMENAKPFLDENGAAKNEAKARVTVSNALRNFALVEKAIEKVSTAAFETKKSAGDAQRFASAASVVASSFVARWHAGAAHEYFSRAENAVADARTKKSLIDMYVSKLPSGKRLPFVANVEEAAQGLDTANAKLREVRSAAELAEVSKVKVSEYEKEFNAEFENKSSELEGLAEKTEAASDLVVEHEKKGRAALSELIVATTTVTNAADSLGATRDEAAAPLLLYGVLSLTLALMASVVLV